MKDRNKIVLKLKEVGIISTKTATYCTKQLEENITGSKFYFKIHKDSNIETMPLIPLQSCISAPIHHLSIVLTNILHLLLRVENIPSFIYDSNQLLYNLRNLGRIPADCTLISSDVVALYPSIPHVEGFRAVKEILQKKTEYSTKQIKVVIEALEFVITENYMKWNGQIYKKTSGVAMGTPVAVAYTNIFMHWVDAQILFMNIFDISILLYIYNYLPSTPALCSTLPELRSYYIPYLPAIPLLSERLLRTTLPYYIFS